MNGRFFGGRQVCVLPLEGFTRFADHVYSSQIQASLYDGREQFKASGRGDEFLDPDEREAEEKQRLDRFAAWLVDERGEDGEDTPA